MGGEARATSAEPRRHHLVPQFYLRSFADEKGRVRGVERATGNEFTTGTTNVLVERDYYTVSSVDAEDDHGLIEGLYAQVEGLVAPIFEQLRSGEFPLGGEERSEFASFMASQITRGRHHRESMQNLTDVRGRQMLRMAASQPPSYWAERRAEWEADPVGPEPPEPLTDEQRRMLIEGTAFDVKPSREHVIEMSFVAFDEMTFMFMVMTWQLVVFDEPCLFTSEHPVTYWRGPSSANAYAFYGIGPATSDEVRMPISPTRALVLTPPELGRKPFDRSEHHHTYPGDRAAAKRLNWGTLTFPPSERLLLCPDVEQHPLPATLGQLHRAFA
jgi:Protein of unknown function (DUF4238)